MAGLKASTESSGTYKKTAVKAKKGKTSGKAFALSEEYVVDSDSDGGTEDPPPSTTPIASVKASEVSTSKAKIIVTPPTTASKSNGSSKSKNVDQSAKKHPGGSVDLKVNGNTPRNVKQVENKPTQKPETPSTQAQGGFVTAAEKPGAKPTSTSKANLPAGRTQQKVVESQDNSQEEDEETDEESSDSTGSEGGITKKTAAQPPSKPQSSSSKATTPKAPAPKRKLASPEPSESSTSDESSSDEENPPTNDNVKHAKQPQYVGFYGSRRLY